MQELEQKYKLIKKKLKREKELSEEQKKEINYWQDK